MNRNVTKVTNDRNSNIIGTLDSYLVINSNMLYLSRLVEYVFFIILCIQCDEFYFHIIGTFVEAFQLQGSKVREMNNEPSLFYILVQI